MTLTRDLALLAPAAHQNADSTHSLLTHRVWPPCRAETGAPLLNSSRDATR